MADIGAQGAEYLKSKLKLTDEEWRRLSTNARSNGWWMSQISQLSLIDDTMKSLSNAMRNGVSMAEWKQQAAGALHRAWGRGATDAAGRVFNQGARVELIWRNAMQTSYNSARYDQLSQPSVKNLYPMWEFRAVMDGETSETCGALHGTVKPAGDSWWNSHTPPLHHGCRSTFRPVTRGQAATKKEAVFHPPKVDVGEGFGKSPKVSGMTQQVYSRALTEGDPELLALFKTRLKKQKAIMDELKGELAKRKK